jgi:S1-C subfamily serine protease
VPAFGIDLKDLPAGEREALKLPAGKGIKIISVKPGSGAEAAGLKANDVLLAMDGQNFGRVSTFIETVRARAPG